MDPNANLEKQLDLANRLVNAVQNGEGNGIDQDDAYTLAEHVIALHEWIKRGGFLPKAWNATAKPGR